MKLAALGIGASVALCAGTAMAGVTFSATVGTLSAEAEFSVVGSSLRVVLTNSSMHDALIPIDILTALFWDIDGDPVSLTRDSAVLNAGSVVLFGGTDPGGVVGGEWTYRGDLVGAPRDSRYGISSVGFDLFGPFDLFPGSNLQGPVGPNGLEYGITSAGDDPTTGNTPVTGVNALIKYSVVFMLGGIGSDFDLGRIYNVNWQYGTDLEEGPNTPAPGVLGLLGLALVAARRRR